MESTPSCVQFETDNYKEADYIEADNEPYDECNHELFCVAEKDSDYIDIDDLYWWWIGYIRIYFGNISFESEMSLWYSAKGIRKFLYPLKI